MLLTVTKTFLLFLSLLAIAGRASVAFAEDLAAPPSDGEHWTAYGFSIAAPSSMWPMLEMLHTYHFDWELYSAQQRPTPLVWAPLPPGVYGQYVPALNVVKVSSALQSESVEVG